MGSIFFDAIFSFTVGNNLMQASQIYQLIAQNPKGLLNKDSFNREKGESGDGLEKLFMESADTGAQFIDGNRAAFMVTFYNALNNIGAKYNENGWNLSSLNLGRADKKAVEKDCNRIMQLAMTTAFEPLKAINGLLVMMYETNPSRTLSN